MIAESMDLLCEKTSPLEPNWLRVDNSVGNCRYRVARGMIDFNQRIVCEGVQTFAGLGYRERLPSRVVR